MKLPTLACVALTTSLALHGAAGAAPEGAGAPIDEGIISDVNGAGDIVGEMREATGRRRAVMSRQGQVTELGTLGGTDSYATAVNEAGVVIGASLTAANEWHGFVWRPGSGMRDLGTLGGRGSHAVALGRNGHVVGYADTADDAYHAFVHDGARMTGLGTLGGRNSYATAVNAHGHVVGPAPAAA